MNPETLSFWLSFASYFVIVAIILCFAVLGYFLYRYPTLKAQYEAEQRERQAPNHPTSETRFESYKKHLEAFKNKPIL
jgi:O-antigen ligase